MIDTNQMGKIVLFLYPIPKLLKNPSSLYTKEGLKKCTKSIRITNIVIAELRLCILIK
jgi:hypothetical protein